MTLLTCAELLHVEVFLSIDSCLAVSTELCGLVVPRMWRSNSLKVNTTDGRVDTHKHTHTPVTGDIRAVWPQRRAVNLLELRGRFNYSSVNLQTQSAHEGSTCGLLCKHCGDIQSVWTKLHSDISPFYSRMSDRWRHLTLGPVWHSAACLQALGEYTLALTIDFIPTAEQLLKLFQPTDQAPLTHRREKFVRASSLLQFSAENWHRCWQWHENTKRAAAPGLTGSVAV